MNDDDRLLILTGFALQCLVPTPSKNRKLDLPALAAAAAQLGALTLGAMGADEVGAESVCVTAEGVRKAFAGAYSSKAQPHEIVDLMIQRLGLYVPGREDTET